MVDVSDKLVTHRTATATGSIQVSPEIMAAVKSGNVKKGDVLGVARVAGIMGVKPVSYTHLITISGTTQTDIANIKAPNCTSHLFI